MGMDRHRNLLPRDCCATSSYAEQKVCMDACVSAGVTEVFDACHCWGRQHFWGTGRTHSLDRGLADGLWGSVTLPAASLAAGPLLGKQ